jgi:hypothetical protein
LHPSEDKDWPELNLNSNQPLHFFSRVIARECQDELCTIGLSSRDCVKGVLSDLLSNTSKL